MRAPGGAPGRRCGVARRSAAARRARKSQNVRRKQGQHVVKRSAGNRSTHSSTTCQQRVVVQEHEARCRAGSPRPRRRPRPDRRRGESARLMPPGELRRAMTARRPAGAGRRGRRTQAVEIGAIGQPLQGILPGSRCARSVLKSCTAACVPPRSAGTSRVGRVVVERAQRAGQADAESAATRPSTTRRDHAGVGLAHVAVAEDVRQRRQVHPSAGRRRWRPPPRPERAIIDARRPRAGRRGWTARAGR